MILVCNKLDQFKGSEVHCDILISSVFILEPKRLRNQVDKVSATLALRCFNKAQVP